VHAAAIQDADGLHDLLQRAKPLRNRLRAVVADGVHNRKRSLDARLPARGLSVLVRLGAEGFGLTIWSTLRMTRRVAGSGVWRS
jgi:hypothetical protein